MMWGCKKDNINDDNGLQLIDSLAWMDSIVGRYIVKGTKSNWSMAFPENNSTDTIYDTLFLSVQANQIINVSVWNKEQSLLLSKSSSLKATYHDFASLYDATVALYKENDSIYYWLSDGGHGGGSNTYLRGHKLIE